jgi:hypothetical protein
MARGKPVPQELVARIKGAAGLITHKSISYLTGVPLGTVSGLCDGRLRKSVPPDTGLVEKLKAVMRGEP